MERNHHTSKHSCGSSSNLTFQTPIPLPLPRVLSHPSLAAIVHLIHQLSIYHSLMHSFIHPLSPYHPSSASRQTRKLNYQVTVGRVTCKSFHTLRIPHIPISHLPSPNLIQINHPWPSTAKRWVWSRFTDVDARDFCFAPFFPFSCPARGESKSESAHAHASGS